MSNLYMTIGMIGSGKSAWAKQFAKDNANVKILDGDSIRTMTAGYYLYDHNFENTISKIIVESAILILNDGYSVIIDECNLMQKHREGMIDAIQQFTNPSYIVAVVFDIHSKEWHISNRCNNLRGYTKNQWEDVWDKHNNVFEPFNKTTESYFNSIIKPII